tara:strand:+ start:45 stop:458 length:414 start_codon:yes stop_codon:yes gene_type:complete
MALITYIDGIPTFSTQVEALAWGQQHGNISGFHTHIVNNEITYMAGVDHSAITSSYTVQLNAPLTPSQSITLQPVSMPVTIPAITITQQITQPVSQPMVQPMVQQPMTQPVQQPVQPAMPVYTPPTGGGGGGGGGGY